MIWPFKLGRASCQASRPHGRSLATLISPPIICSSQWIRGSQMCKRYLQRHSTTNNWCSNKTSHFQRKPSTTCTLNEGALIMIRACCRHPLSIMMADCQLLSRTQATTQSKKSQQCLAWLPFSWKLWEQCKRLPLTLSCPSTSCCNQETFSCCTTLLFCMVVRASQMARWVIRMHVLAVWGWGKSNVEEIGLKKSKQLCFLPAVVCS